MAADDEEELLSHDWVKQALATVEGPGGQPILSYDVAKCNLAFELEEDSPDLWAELTVTYYVWGGKKSSGFAPVGENKVENLTCADAAGKRLRAEVNRGSGKFLVWYFPEMATGLNTVTVRCKILDAVQQYGDRFVLDAPWVGDWPVPVHCQNVEVVFPAGVKPKVLQVAPGNHPYETLLRNASQAERDWRRGKIVLRQTQMPLTDSRFHLEFRPE